MPDPIVRSAGLHHVTSIAGDPRRNIAFYTRILGLRLVKKTVNFDDPHTYHLYYGDDAGSAGSILTFFPWSHVAPGRDGAGMTGATAFTAPLASLDWWMTRLRALGIAYAEPVVRFGNVLLALRDPDGMALELVFAARAPGQTASRDGDIPAEHAITGFFGVTLFVRAIRDTAAIMTDVLGWSQIAEENGIVRLRAPDVADEPVIGTIVDLRMSGIEGRMGAGSVHHVAFRAADDSAQAAMAGRLSKISGIRATPQQDRQYFRSIYFREPSGILFEIATDAPGFAIDEPVETMGSRLMLPAWYEHRRAEIEAALPALD